VEIIDQSCTRHGKVKLPVALLALQRIGELSAMGVRRDTPIFFRRVNPVRFERCGRVLYRLNERFAEGDWPDSAPATRHCRRRR
jgi:hypothetical protein